MKQQIRRFISVSLKLYIVALLIVATILSPLSLSAVPIVVLLWFLYQLRWPLNSVVVLMTDVFMFFTTVLLFLEPFGTFLALLPALPVLGLVWLQLGETSVRMARVEQPEKMSSRPTSVYLTLLTSTGAVLAVSILTGNLGLLVASIVLVVFFGLLGIIALRGMPLQPVQVESEYIQVVAGSTADRNITVTLGSKSGGLVFLGSPYEWVTVQPDEMLMTAEKATVSISVTPELSGPTEIKLTGQAVDRWGLFRTSFEVEAAHLFVIPRARYAAWLAERYLSGTSQGSLPLVTNMTVRKTSFNMRQGVEYYGSQQYHPGDSMKNIDWKHSIKYNELITKEFIEFSGESAVLLINLAVGDEREADILAYNIIISALTLARNDIPAAIAAYNTDEVVMTTVTMNHQQLVSRSLQVAREMVTYVDPVRYLSHPDITRLRANMRQTGRSENPAAKVLKEILQIEYDIIRRNAEKNPVMRALKEGLARSEKRANIVIISHRNHDAEALEYAALQYRNKGNAVITL